MSTRRNRSIGAAAAAGLALAGLLAAGCARAPARPLRASVESCALSGVAAIKHRVIVTALPAACRGLTRAQVNFAVGSALYAMTGTVHGRARRRARMLELSPLLAHLVSLVPAQRGPPPEPAPGARRAGGPSLGLLALISWLVTVGLGAWMMGRWITRGGFRRARASKAGLPPSLIFAHFGLAVAGLLAWITYLATGATGVAWAACALLLPVAGLGMALVSLWLPERSLAAATRPAAQPVPAVGATPVLVSVDPPPARHPPALIVAAHGAFAVATILLALLAAVGSG
jgi:hypothetical protein